MTRPRIEEKLAQRRQFRLGFEPSATRPVRCADGLSRPALHCVQLDDGLWVPKHTAQQKDGAARA